MVRLSRFRRLLRFFNREEAATSVEYAVMLALILIAVIGAIGAVGGETGGLWGTLDADMANAGLGK
jgi:pilus assembly protein Flp/PilA